jgi:hypothetical protein
MATFRPKVSESSIRRPTDSSKSKGRIQNPPRYPEAGGFMARQKLRNPLQPGKPGDTK